MGIPSVSSHFYCSFLELHCAECFCGGNFEVCDPYYVAFSVSYLCFGSVICFSSVHVNVAALARSLGLYSSDRPSQGKVFVHPSADN